MLRSIEIATLQDCLRDKLSDCTIVTYLYRIAVTTVTEFKTEHCIMFLRLFRQTQCLYIQLQLAYVENLRQGPLL